MCGVHRITCAPCHTEYLADRISAVLCARLFTELGGISRAARTRSDRSTQPPRPPPARLGAGRGADDPARRRPLRSSSCGPPSRCATCAPRSLAVRRATARSVTLTLRPNDNWTGFRAGQFVRLGVEIDGVRHTRTYSPACSAHAGDLLELTVTRAARRRGLRRSCARARDPAWSSSLSQAEGDFALPDERPRELLLISGGSGITPVMSMLRTLCDEGHDGAGRLPALRARRARCRVRARARPRSPPRHPNVRLLRGFSRRPDARRAGRPLRPLARRGGGDRPGRRADVRVRADRAGRGGAHDVGGGRARRAALRRAVRAAGARARRRRTARRRQRALRCAAVARRRAPARRCSSRPRPRASRRSSAAAWASATPAPAASSRAPCATCAPARSRPRPTRTIQICVNAPGRRRRRSTSDRPRSQRHEHDLTAAAHPRAARRARRRARRASASASSPTSASATPPTSAA